MIKTMQKRPESITIQLRYPRMPWEFGTNHARFFESENSWPKFWTVQNFWAEFPIDLRIARTHYGLCESVKTITNCVRFSHESKYLSIRGIRGLCGIGVLGRLSYTSEIWHMHAMNCLASEYAIYKTMQSIDCFCLATEECEITSCVHAGM